MMGAEGCGGRDSGDRKEQERRTSRFQLRVTATRSFRLDQTSQRENVVIGGNSERRHYLSAVANKHGLRAVLFRLKYR